MLLAKSRESKSLGKNLIKSTGCILSVSAFPFLTEAQESASPAASVSDFGTVVSISLSLFVVLALIFGMAYLMRRFTVTSSGNGQLKVVASMMAGAKERILVLQVGDEQHLIGITPNNINHLSTLKSPIEPPTPKAFTEGGGKFKDKLVEAMASRIRQEKKHD